MKGLTVAVSSLALAVFAVFVLLAYRTYVEHRAFRAQAVFAADSLEALYIRGQDSTGYGAEAQNNIQVLLGYAVTTGDLHYALAAQHELQAIRKASSEQSAPAASTSGSGLITQEKDGTKQILDCLLDLQTWPTLGGALHCPSQ